MGAVVYNRPIPAKNGLVAEFTQYQFGRDTNAGDGIGFFLADGTVELETVGADGGGLGYANKGPVGESGSQAGLPAGYFGLGFDVRGNYAATSDDVAPQCPGESGGPEEDSVTLRGPAPPSPGYCAVGSSQKLRSLGIANRGTAYSLRAERGGLSSPTSAQLQSGLRASQRRTRVVVYPRAEGAAGPRVTVEMDFGAGYVNVLDRVMPARSPDTIRFGFLASTGGKRDAHLLSDVRIGTVMTPPDIDFTKTVSGANEGTYNLDDTVQYKFLIDNNGDASLYDLQLSDPSVQDISCDGIPGASIAELGVDSRAVCTASHIISETDRDSLHYLNTATISLEVPGGEPTTLATDSVDVPVNPGAEDASKVIHPGGIALFNLWDTGSSLGLVQPSVSDKVSVALLGTDGKPASNNTVFVPEQGTWVFSGVPGSENEGSSATGEVKFTPIDNDYAGTVTPVKYRVTSKVLANDVAGMAEGTLSVTISNAPVPVCTKAEHKGSGAFWQFGNKAQLAFGATGATPSVGAATGVISGNATSFTVSDMWGNLQFTVDPGQGRIITKSGAPMTRGGDGDDADDEITFDLGAGASPVTAFPLEQGSGKYVVVTSSATATNPGQLTYRVIDMALNQGEGGLEGEMSTNLGLGGVGCHLRAQRGRERLLGHQPATRPRGHQRVRVRQRRPSS